MNTRLKTTIKRAVRVARTARLIQFAGKFDLEAAGESVRTWDVDVQLPGEWSVGVIVGPSMAGKTTLANELFPGQLVEQGHWDWPGGKFIGDGFPKGMGVDEIAGLLSSVGFSSPPDWMKPYAALSNGGKFRVDLARTLAERPQLAVVDEFGSLVHKEARTIAAAAASKAVRRRGGKLVALCVHEDAVEYFEPDWVIRVEPGQRVTCRHTRGSVRRPPIELRIERTTAEAWRWFRHHHYLSHELHPGSKCFVGFVGDETGAGQLAVFTAVLPFPHAVRPGWREHRTVCLPNFQGVGIGNAMSAFVASLFVATGKPYFSSTSHPAMVRHRMRSKLWRTTCKPTIQRSHGGGKSTGMRATSSTSRITAGFEFRGEARREAARAFGIV